MYTSIKPELEKRNLDTVFSLNHVSFLYVYLEMFQLSEADMALSSDCAALWSVHMITWPVVQLWWLTERVIVDEHIQMAPGKSWSFVEMCGFGIESGRQGQVLWGLSHSKHGSHGTASMVIWPSEGVGNLLPWTEEHFYMVSICGLLCYFNLSGISSRHPRDVGHSRTFTGVLRSQPLPPFP